MAIIVEVEGVTQELSSLSESWLHEQILMRLKDGVPTCVRVYIKTEDVNIVLASGDCSSSLGGARKISQRENFLFDLWDQFDLKDSPINSGKLVAFLKRIKQEISP